MDDNTNSRFITESVYDGVKIIYDSELDYLITYKPDGSYSASDANGEDVYYIYPDGRGVFYTDQGEIDTGDPITIDQINHDTTFTRLDGTTVTISNKKLVKKVSGNSDSLIVTTYYNDDGSRRDELSTGEKYYFNEDDKIYRKEYPDGSYEENDYNSDGILLSTRFSSGDIKYYDENGHEYKHDYGDGMISLKTEYGKDFVFYDSGTFAFYDDETLYGNYIIDDENNIVYQDQNGNTVCRSPSSGKIVKMMYQDGTIRFFDHETKAQTEIKNGKTTYSLVNHIEYGDEEYEKILKTLNSIDNIKIYDACSNIENVVSSFPDSYSDSLVSSIGNNINSHVDLIKALSEMTNFSVLAYQTCDDKLCEILFTLVDSIFGDVNDFYSTVFKATINYDLENNKGILEYREDTNFSTISKKVSRIVEISDFIMEYNPERFGISKLEMYTNLNYIYDKRGEKEMDFIVHALKNNCPDNFFIYSFNPGPLWERNGHYDFDSTGVKKYQTNSEFFMINGHELEIVQVLPSDCTSTELLAYNFAKANIINTIRTFPEEYMNAADQKNNAVILTCDRNSQTFNDDSWGGYYCPLNFLAPEDGTVVIDAHGSLYDNDYYTIDVITHEFGHKYDDILNGMGKFDISESRSMTDKSKKWKSLYKEYKGILPDIVEGGYTEKLFEDSVAPRAEFFAESMVAYFLKPDELKSLCPEVYSEITDIMGHDYGGAYVNGIGDVIGTYDNVTSNSYPKYAQNTPQPGPGPMPTPSPSN